MTAAPPSPPDPPVLALRDLTVEFATRAGTVHAVTGVSLDVRPGEVLGVVGESGCGKTVTLLAGLRLLAEPPARVVGGQALFRGRDLLQLSRRELRRIRGRDIGVVFQDPSTSLHPSLRIGDQIGEALRVHDRGMSADAARARTVELLELVGVPRPAGRLRDHPHQWSGGMRQRAVIAMAIANRPALLIADEPTSALDVTTQAQVLDVLRRAAADVGAATILVSHDLGVIAELADRVVVMYGGRVVETAPVDELFARPRHPYTAALLASVPRLDGPVPPPDPLRRARRSPPPPDGRATTGPVLRVEGLSRHFPTRDGVVRAVDGVSFEIAAGETLGLVGESGCGKSTLARTVVRLLEPTAGRVYLDGREITGLRGRTSRALCAELQIVFQDPYASLNPRMRVGQSVSQPLRIHGRYAGSAGPARVRELFELVGLDPASGDRFPHEFSGGQRQRIGIARALASGPRVLVLDEPVSALDVSVRAQIVALLERLQRDLGLAYLFIAHDLAVVRRLADRVAVMYLGRIVETGPRDAVFGGATHPYTRSLLSAVPVPDPVGRASRGRILLAGDPPDPTHLPSGCRFRTRCRQAERGCAAQDPVLLRPPPAVPGHLSACHLAERGETGTRE